MIDKELTEHASPDKMHLLLMYCFVVKRERKRWGRNDSEEERETACKKGDNMLPNVGTYFTKLHGIIFVLERLDCEFVKIFCSSVVENGSFLF